MARTPGSINQNIHFKTREAFNINQLYNEKKLLSGENPPAFWFQRLITLSNNPPYVIAFREPTTIKASSFNLENYIDENFKIKPEWQSKIDITMPTGRNNDEINSDILQFTNSIANYYLTEENLDSQTGIIKIRKELLYLESLCEQGMNISYNCNYNRKFLIYDGYNGNFHQVQSTVNFSAYADEENRKKWESSLIILWEYLNSCVYDLHQIFGAPIFKTKKGYSKVNFDDWLREGLSQYLEIENNNLKDEQKIFYLLKWQILGKREFKTPKKIK
jgi:hypothetical protein